MPSITSWIRLEPLNGDAEMQEGLQASIHDPLWLLARQWQTGEFRAQDTGSPVVARLQTHLQPLTRFQPGPPPTRFTHYGITDFEVQAWIEGDWKTVPDGHVIGNNCVYVRFKFPPVITDRIRVLVHQTVDGYSRIVEVEAYQAEDTFWVNNALPAGAVAYADNETWDWARNPSNPTGGPTHVSPLANGMHQHYFDSANPPLLVQPNDTLFAEIYLDAYNPPQEVMLQWNTEGWLHRAYWGKNLINWGRDGTSQRFYMGPLPLAGQWVRLEVPAALVGLEGHQVNGMAFTLFDGHAVWGRAGILLPAVDRPNVALQVHGTTALASSMYSENFSPEGAINGDHRGLGWGNKGGWNDGTPDDFPDWLEVRFKQPMTIDEIGVATVQDDFEHPIEPVPSQIWTAQTYDPVHLALETLVEREALSWANNLNFAAQSGLHFLRVLDRFDLGDNRAACMAKFPLEAPPDFNEMDSSSQRFSRVMAGRVPDGRAIYQAAKIGNLEAEIKNTNPSNSSAVLSAVREWLVWYESLVSQPPAGSTAWNADRMEYSFHLTAEAAGGKTILVTPEYSSGHLDWFDLDLFSKDPLLVSDEGLDVRELLPMPVAFPGMPLPRYWEMEDAQVDFGALNAGPGELARLLFVDQMLTYGNDWFLIPFEMPAGTVCQVYSFEVFDTFGIPISIPHYSAQDASRHPWHVYCLSDYGGLASTRPVSNPKIFFLPNTLGPSLESPLLEEVILRRDEYANLAWAIERTVESVTGQPLNRFEAWQEQRQRQAEENEATGSAAGSSAPLRYRLGSQMPDYWYPLLPVRARAGVREIRLDRGALPRPDGSPGKLEPRGRILEPGRPLRLYEEEVPREGARVIRAYQYARWTDGSTHLWIGRRKQPGGGEASSGLRFDVVERA